MASGVTVDRLECRRLMSATVYQAESATLSGGTTADHNLPGYTGTGFANLPISGGAVTFSVPVMTAGVYRLVFRYALGNPAHTAALSVNGVAVTGGITFPATGSWSTWSTKAVLLNLVAGTNAIKLASVGQDPGNIDSLTVSPALDGTVSLTTVSTTAYGAGDVNSCAIAVNNLFTDTKSHLQFAAFYDTTGEIILARRTTGATTWKTYDTGISDPTTLSDDHDVIAVAADGAGYLHMSWGMHNISLNYAVSKVPVTTATLTSVGFNKLTAATAPTLFASGGSTTNEVTYPQFYRIPNSNDLAFTYRNGGTGGGSGNGDQYFDRYSVTTKTWTNQLVIDGEATNVNAYINRLAYTPTGVLVMTWTWRSTPNWQTNSNLCYAQSPDNGVTWYRQGGTSKYALPIVQSGTNAASVAQVVKSFPQGSSWINQTSETTDTKGNPIVATFSTPNYNPATKTGDVNRQYVLSYYDGSAWQSTQVSHRTSDTAIDSSGGSVRDLGRPIVLVDSAGRVLVVTRSEDTAMGTNTKAATPNNDIVVYYTSKLAGSATVWSSVTLDGTNMGAYEPTYDAALWASSNQLNLFYEPVGLAGQTAGTVKVLAWDETAFFAGT